MSVLVGTYTKTAHYHLLWWKSFSNPCHTDLIPLKTNYVLVLSSDQYCFLPHLVAPQFHFHQYQHPKTQQIAST